MMDLSRLVWREGMYLGQHHFQLQQRYFDDSVRFAIEQLFFRPYGLAACALDAERLRNGVVAVRSARGLLPDGTPFSFPDSDLAPPPLDLGTRLGPMVQTARLVLALPALRRDAPNVVRDGQPRDRAARLQSGERQMLDETTGGDPCTVEFGVKALRVALDDDLQHGEIALPIARVRRTGADAFEVDDAYVPPLLAIGASDALMERVRQLVERLESKAESLAADATSSQRGRGALDVANVWLLHTLHASLAPLRHLLATTDAHPERLYVELARLAGALCTFALDAHPRDLPAYDHDDVGRCIDTLLRLIRERIDWVRPTNFVRVPFDRASLRYASRTTGKEVAVDGYRATLTDERALGRAQWLLGVRADVPPATIAAQVPERVKVCSANGVSFLVAHAQPGFALTHLPTPPASIAPQVGTQYFAVTRAGPCVRLVEESREVGVYVPESIPNAQLELVIVYDG